MASKLATDDISAARVLAGFCSFLFPGLGQLLIDRVQSALLFLLGAILLWAAGTFLISSGIDTQSIALVFLGAVICLVPNVLSAYYAANGHKVIFSPVSQINKEAIHERTQISDNSEGYGFHDYESYKIWCQDNGNEPMSFQQFQDTFGEEM